MPRAVIYCRVSTDEQFKKGYSIPSQRKECVDFTVKSGYEIDKIFIEEGESACNLNRTQLKEMFVYCEENKNKIDALVFWKWDRLSRGEQSDYYHLNQFFNKNKIKPLSATENNDDTPEAEFYRWINQGTSRYEWRKIGERTRLGLKGALDKGRWLSLAPFGYINDREMSLRPHPENAKYVKKAFELFSTGLYSQADLIEELRKFGMKKCDKNKIFRMLRHKAYIGLIENKYFDEPIRGIFEPLVDEETFYRVQAILEGRKPVITSYKIDNEEFPLRRYVRCPNCNHPLTASYSKGRSKKYAYYHCHQSDCNIHYRIRKEKLEEDYAKHLEIIKPKVEILKLFRAILQDVYKKSIKEKTELKRKLEKDMEKLLEDKKKLILKYNDDKIEEEDYKFLKEDINASVTAIKTDLAGLDIPQHNIKQYLDSCCFLLTNLKDLWCNSEFEFKKRLQQIIYPNGVQYVSGEFRTNKKSVIFCICEHLTDDLLDMGRVMGFEPMYIGTTIRGLNHLTIPATFYYSILNFCAAVPVSEP